MLVYIVSASGPYPEKAWNSRFYLTQEDAKEVRDLLNALNKPAVYTVYEMTLESHK